MTATQSEVAHAAGERRLMVVVIVLAITGLLIGIFGSEPWMGAISFLCIPIVGPIALFCSGK